MRKVSGMYNSYFGFSQSPFENNLDQRFLFLGEDHREVLAALLYFFETKKGFAIVCGDVGTGKTMLINSLLNRLPATVKPIIISNPCVNSQDLLFYLAKTLKIKTTGLENVLELTDKVRNALLKAKHQDKHIILIIDEAHLLSDQALEEIRLLSNIESQDQKLLQILLVGQNELSHKLDSPEMRHLRQRININRFLSHLNYSETIQYIDHRLQQVGASFASVLEDNGKGLIFKLTKGVPRNINQLCDNALLISMTEGQRRVNRKTLKKAKEALQTDRIFTLKAWRKKARSHFGKYGELWVPIGTGVIVILLGIILLMAGFWPGKSRLEPQINKSAEQTLLENQGGPESPKVKAGQTPNPNQKMVMLEPIEPRSKPLNPLAQKSDQGNRLAPEAGGPSSTTPSSIPTKEEGAPQGEKESSIPPTVAMAIDQKPPPAKEAQAAVPDFTQFLIEEGENLSTIASQQYPEDSKLGMLAIILQNSEIANEDIIRTREVLYLPKINFSNRTIHLKDNLFYAFYGRYTSPESLRRAAAELEARKVKFMVRNTKNAAGNLTQRIFIGGYDTPENLEKTLTSLKLYKRGRHLGLDKNETPAKTHFFGSKRFGYLGSQKEGDLCPPAA